MPEPKPMPGVGGPPSCLDQAVVAAAAADRVLRRVERVGLRTRTSCACSSRGRARAAARCANGDAERRRARPAPRRSARRRRRDRWSAIAGRVGDHGRVLRRACESSTRSGLRVERVAALLATSVVGVRREVGAQRARRSAAGRPASPSELSSSATLAQPERGGRSRQPRAMTSTSTSGSSAPSDLDADLVVLAVAAGLRLLVAEVRARRTRPSTASAGGAATNARTTDAVPSGRSAMCRPPLSLEVVHLLADDVGGLADPLEHPDVLEHRRHAASP